MTARHSKKRVSRYLPAANQGLGIDSAGLEVMARRDERDGEPANLSFRGGSNNDPSPKAFQERIVAFRKIKTVPSLSQPSVIGDLHTNQSNYGSEETKHVSFLGGRRGYLLHVLEYIQ